MIVRRITLHQFAGGSGRSVEFRAGLNVMLGPNEAGKTTLSAALRCVLFDGGPMTQARFRSDIQPYLPVGIGDTARVTLEFVSAGKVCSLERSWTTPRGVASRMHLPDGGEVSDEEEIQRFVAQCLGVTPGTYEHVLCVSQARLKETIDRLTEDADGASGGFADVLRTSLYESDGIATDLLVTSLDKQIDDYFGHWDRVSNAPDKGRGLEAPWERGAGVIVKAYYDYLRAKKAFEEADKYEKRIDEFAKQERSLGERKSDLSERVNAFAPLADAARRRADLSVKLRESEREARELRKVLEEWPKAEFELAAATDAIQSLLARHASLTTELGEAKERTRTRALREAFAKAEVYHNRVSEEEQRLSQLPNITDKQWTVLEKEHASLQRLEIKISARKLGVRIAAKALVDLTLKAGSGSKSVHLDPGEDFSTTVAGRLSISHRDWNLDVWSTEEDAEDLERLHAETSNRLASLLGEIGLRTFEEAGSAWQRIAAQRERVKESRVALGTILGQESFEDLRRRIQELPPTNSGRTEDDINADLRKIADEGGEKRATQKDRKKQSDDWTRTFGSRDEAFKRFTLFTAEEQRLKAAIEQCQPLPPGFENAEAFLTEYDSTQRGFHEAERALTEIEKARLDYEKSSPDQSREELQEIVAVRKADFERAQRHGEAYLRIHEELERLLKALDNNLFEPYHQRVRELLSAMTLRRHEAIRMSGNIPETLGVPGRQLAVSQLSVGTKDVLAVAIRLAMAEVHLPPGDGFILLDDPLVNLDPDRQKAAAACLKEFAHNHQVILLTCHPSHADLLGGATLVLPLSATADPRESP